MNFFKAKSIGTQNLLKQNKKKESIMEKLTHGCCGLNCEECPVFIATVNDDDALRQKTAFLKL